MMDNPNFLENQTIFAEEEPYHISQQRKKATNEASVKKPPTKFFGLVVLLVVFSVVGGIIMIMMNGQKAPTQVGNTATPTPAPQTSTQIDQMMNELRSDLDEADPAKTSLPFPPVADQVRISK